MTDYRTLENISIRRSGTVFSSPEAGEHVEKEYELVSDKENEEGQRIIVLKRKSTQQFEQDINELIDRVLKGLGEEESRVTRGILHDVFRDETHEVIEALLGKLRRGEKVTTAPGCFKLRIGNQRKGKGKGKGAEIMLRG